MRYSDTIEQHVACPRNAGRLEAPTGIGRATNEACGDVLELSLVIEQGRIVAAGFQAAGCPPALAAGSVLTELLQGRTPQEARRLSTEELETALGGVPRAKRHALTLGLDALLLALDSAVC